MIEDYGAYNGTTIREHLPVHDVTTGSLVELSGHNAIDIILDSGTPLYAVTSGTAYRITNWTIPGGPQGWASVVVSDVLKDDQGDPIAFLYGHVREFDVPKRSAGGRGRADREKRRRSRRPGTRFQRPGERALRNHRVAESADRPCWYGQSTPVPRASVRARCRRAGRLQITVGRRLRDSTGIGV